MALAILGLAISRSVIAIRVVGTAINIWHEYVSEGYYVDPSYIDLWLGQIALAIAVVIWVILRTSRAPLQTLHA